MADGIGCKCMANCQADCACGADWTPKELVAARERISQLEAQIEKLMRGEFICKRCGLRKDDDSGQAIFKDCMTTTTQFNGDEISNLIRNLENTSYNEGSHDLACRCGDALTVIKQLLSAQAPALLAKKREGMKISAEGVLGRIRDGRHYDGLNFNCGEMLRHLEMMAAKFYAGEVSIVDEFLQLYDLDKDRPNTGAKQ